MTDEELGNLERHIGLGHQTITLDSWECQQLINALRAEREAHQAARELAEAVIEQASLCAMDGHWPELEAAMRAYDAARAESGASDEK